MKESAETRKHHPFSPSSLQVREVSPYFATVDGDSEASRAGTLQHDAVDRDELPESLSDVQAEAVVHCKNYWQKIALRFPNGIFINEEYLNVDDEIVYDEDGFEWLGTTGGYLDRGIVSADLKCAAICDWKFGQWSVEPAATNLQGFSYALGLLHRYPSLEEIEVHFVLPHRNEETSHTFKRADFAGMYLRVKATVHRAMEAKWSLLRASAYREELAALAGCYATTSSCLFCGNLGKCPLVAQLALKVGKKFHPIEVPDSITPSLIIDPAQAKLGLEVASLLGVWAKAFRAQATLKAIENDDFMPDGYRLKQRREREIVDSKKAEEIAKEHGLTDEDVEASKSLKLTPLFHAARAKAERGQKEAAEDALSDALIEAGAVEVNESAIFLERLKS